MIVTKPIKTLYFLKSSPRRVLSVFPYVGRNKPLEAIMEMRYDIVQICTFYIRGVILGSYELMD